VEGLRRRREITEAIPTAELEALRGSDGPVGKRIRAMCGPVALATIFEVRTRRQTFELSCGGAPAGEVALDDTTIPVGDQVPPARLKRVEVEARPTFEASLAGFVLAMREECALRPATLSKYQAGLLSRGLQPDRATHLGSTAIDPSLSVGAVAFAVMRKHFEVFIAKEPSTRLGEDPEQLHDMRVASRRLRAAIAMFRDALPVRTSRLRDELGWVAQALGAVRDLDVQLEQMESWSEGSLAGSQGFEAIRGLVDDARAKARTELLRVLDSRRYARLVRSMTGLLRSGPLRRSARSLAPITDVGSRLLRRHYQLFKRAGDRIGKGSTAAEYHRVRIRGKRLRYALEFLAEVYPGGTDPLIQRLVALQDLLGRQQDADVAGRRLEVLAAGAGLPGASVFAMGAAAERHHREASLLRARFPDVYRRVQGKPWKKLQLIMKRSTPARTRVPPAT
jgi:CHAD domain-containing protein